MAVNIDRGDCVTHPLMPPSAAVSSPIAMHRSSSIDKILPESEPSNGIAFESTNCAPNDTTLVSSQEQPKQTTKWARIKKLLAGVGLTITSAFCFSITTVIVKYMTNIEPSQMALFRYFGILVMSFPITMESKESWFGPSNWWWRLWMFIRSVSGCTSLFFRYSAVTYIPLADATIIILAMPVFVFIFARIFLGEQFGRYHVAALVLSLVGIAFTSKVDTLFTDSHATFEQANMSTTILPHNFTSTITTSSYLSANSSIDPMNDPSKLSNRLIGSLFALGSTTVGSLVYVSVRKMRKTHHSVILFNFALISLVEMCLINVSMHNFKLPSEGYSAYLVMILAVFSFYGQLLLTKALQLEEAGLVSVVRVSGEAFFAFLFQIIFFHELPDQYTIFGAVLVLASVFLMSYRKYIISLPDDSKLKRKFLFLTK